MDDNLDMTEPPAYMTIRDRLNNLLCSLLCSADDKNNIHKNLKNWLTTSWRNYVPTVVGEAGRSVRKFPLCPARYPTL